MEILLITHEACLDHDAGWSHPERPDRIGAVTAGVEASGLEVISVEAPRAERDQILLNHDGGYIDAIERACASGRTALDPDTRVGPGSWEAALRSAGAGLAAVAGLREGAAGAAFVATRPPGHHALFDRAMGFCLFNNIAITARALTSVGEKVAIVDWDVHHGNGTQESFFADPNVLYISLHESGFYPGTGHQHERGEGSGQGSTINFPLPAGTGGDVYRWLMHWAIRPAVETFAPDWLLISAGYDAHVDDPLAGMSLTAEDYAGMASSLRETVPASRTAFFLEGGYDLAALTASTAATLRGCHGEAPGPPAESDTGTGRGWREALDAVGSLRREEGQGSVG